MLVEVNRPPAAAPYGLAARGPAIVHSLLKAGDPTRRLLVLIAGVALSFSVIAARLVDINLFPPVGKGQSTARIAEPRIARPDIVDRNGVILATDIQTASLHANPRKIVDIDEAIEQVTTVLKDLDVKVLRRKLSSKRAFVWIKRELSPGEQAAVHRLGIPGFYFTTESRRVYPHGRTAAQVLGYVNIDNIGAAGIEKYLDRQQLIGRNGAKRQAALAPVRLSLDVRVQYAMRTELAAAMERYCAKAAAGVILKVDTGEVIALTSLPDFNPNEPSGALAGKRLNQITYGVYEPGSTLKAITIAMALDEGTATADKIYDASKPIRIGKAVIGDFHGQKRPLTVREVFIYSSNIGAGKIALEVGEYRHKAFLRKMGLLTKPDLEVPEIGAPRYPRTWREINSVTIGFGHGIAMTPMQLALAGVALVNDGRYVPATFRPRDRETAARLARRVIQPKTSASIRRMMRENVEMGTARQARVEGYAIGGKTGTAEKVINGRYSKKQLRTSFLSAFPIEAPKYVVLIMLDEPKPSPETRNMATAGWNAVPVTGRLITRIAPMLGVLPEIDPQPGDGIKGVAENRSE